MAETANLTDEQKKELALESFGKKKETAAPAKTEEEIDAEKKAEEERLAAEETKKKEEEELAAAGKEDAKPDDTGTQKELTDEQIFEAASKKTGRKISSWDDFKTTRTEEDKKKEIENRDSDKLVYGLKKGLFNRTQLESFISDSKSPKELVYSRELAEAKKEDGDWNEDKEKEFKEEFDEKFGLGLDESASKRKRGEKQIAQIAKTILKDEYASIYSLDSEYDKYETETNSRKTQEQKILTAAPAYKEDVTKVLSDFNKVEMDFAGDKYEIPVSEEIIKSVSEVMLDNDFTSNQILKGYSKEDLTEFARQFIIGQNFQTLAFEAAKKYREKHEKGVRGIPEGGRLEKKDDINDTLTDKQKEALDYFRIKEKPVIAN